ncbi:MAG TPA: hypothetical protein VM934_13275 [Pyrinomonadaceae bacterium]|jgi:hypothetical protein|nr:hypothetical protein [Pyrinomonadaceae bacterium]
MSDDGQQNRDDDVWRRLVQSYNDFAAASKEFMSEGVDRVSLMREALRGRDRLTAIYMARYLDVAELEGLFDELVFLASFSHGAVQTVRDLILSLPRERVLSRIEEAAEPLLSKGDYDEYRRLLELYSELDKSLALKLARRAADEEDEDIREAGEDFLEKLRA